MNILLVEDNPADAILLREQLDDTCQFRTDVTHCLNLASARKSAAESHFDVVILDLNLPDSHGLDTVRSMQTACPDTPIVVLSGEDNQDTAIRAVRLGIEEFLLKGKEPADMLASLIAGAVERKTRTFANKALRHFKLPESPAELDYFCSEIGKSMAANASTSLRTVVLLVELSRKCCSQRLELDADHWVFVVEGVASTEDIDQLASELRRDLCEPIHAGREQVETAIRIGIGVAPTDATTPKELLSKALKAMNRTSGSGHNRWQFYRDELNQQSEKRHRLVEDFNLALATDELRLYYQPYVDARSRIVIGMESLLRWRRPDGFVAPAGAFIPFAEKNGLISRVDDFVLDQVGRQIRDWRINCDDELPISINLSAGQFMSGALVGTIEGMLEQYGVEPRLIELELTESTVIQDIKRVQGVMQDIRSIGVKLAIDDFGTQYASLDYLRKLPLDRLKIDRSFVRDLPDAKTYAVIKSIVSLAHDLGLEVTAEGVETETQAEMVTEAGCDALQGYLFSRPVPAARDTTIFSANRMRLLE